MAKPAKYRAFLVLNLLFPKGVGIFVCINTTVCTDNGVVEISGFTSNNRTNEVNTDEDEMLNWNRSQDSPATSFKELKAIFDSSFKLTNSPVNDKSCQTSGPSSAAVCEADTAQQYEFSSEVARVPTRGLSFRASLSQSSGGGSAQHRLIADVQLRLRRILICYGQNLTNSHQSLEMSASPFDCGRNQTNSHHSSELSTSPFASRFALFARLPSSTSQKIPMTCRQSSNAGDSIPSVESTGLSSWSYLGLTGVAIDVYFSPALYSSQVQTPDDTEFTEVGLKDGPKRRSRAPGKNPHSKFQLDATEGASDSARIFQIPKVKTFYYPFWSKLFSPVGRHSVSSTEQHVYGRTVLEILFVQYVYEFIILIIVVCKLLSRSKEANRRKENTVDLKIPTKSFSVKLNWSRQQNKKGPFNTGSLWEKRGKAVDQTGSESFWGQTSMLNALNRYIFRPWLRAARSEDSRSCLNPSKHNSCIFLNTLLCSSCRRHLDHFRAHNQHTMQVSPVTSFLPNPTCDPAIDLAHVGYRLATLSALPASVPVSRIKLADAGFYFRGQNDEVRCYSCDARHSEWTREDNPMEIHRRLSPNCEHLLRRDRELSALARPLNLGGVGQENTASGTGINTPAEDGDGSQARAQPRVPASRETVTATPSFQGPVASSSAAGPGVPAGGSAARGEGRSHERGVPSTGTGPASPSTGTTPGAGNRMGNIPNTVSASTLTTTSTSANGVPDGNNRRTSTVIPNANSSPRPSGGGGGHGDNAAARAESRPLFPRAALDLGGAVYPMYQDMASRRRTFSHWDDSQAPPLDEVILCGMFYAGYADCVRCFYCGVGLKHWVASDDVWTEHVRWRPGCEYLRAIKGDDFIRDTQRRLGIQSSRDQSDHSRGSSSDVPPGSRNDNSAPPAPAQEQVPTTATSTTSSTTTAASTRTTTAATATTGSMPAARASPASSTAAATANTGQRPGATAASLSGTTATATTSSPSALPSGRSDDQAEARGDNAGGAGVTVAVSSAAEDHGRLVRLEAENRALSQRLRCRVCRQAAIDTILMPCGHLVVCETCARSVTSCPLCQDTIRATARVNIE